VHKERRGLRRYELVAAAAVGAAAVLAVALALHQLS